MPRSILALAAAALGVGLAFVLVLGNHRAPDPATAYLGAVTARGVTPAPGYTGDVVAAGYRVCGDLHAGFAQDAVIADGARDGVGGDLYTHDTVTVLVQEAARLICPTAALER